jgi:tRNA nucleotidyltransferase (CCA-adding enzyme)
MRHIAASGELAHLVAERTWSELVGGLAATRPGVFLQVLRDCAALAWVLPAVDCLFGIPQDERYHPEIDTGLHVQMTLDYAASRGLSNEVRFALLLHDLGKGQTAQADLPSHPDHDKTGLPLVRAVCERLRAPVAFRDLALDVCALHLRCHRALELRPASLLSLLEEADLLRRPDRLEFFLQACEADYRGRKDRSERPYPQAARVRAAHEAALAVKVSALNVSGLSGEEIGKKLRTARIQAISELPSGST